MNETKNTETMRNLTNQETSEIKNADGNSVEINYQLDENSDYAFFTLEGKFITDRIRKVNKEFSGIPVIYFNGPATQGKALVYTF